MSSLTPVPPLDWPHYGITLIPAVKRGFQKYATFSGRASRGEYWWWVLGNAIVLAVLYGLTIGLGLATSGSSGDFGIGGVVPLVLMILWILGTIVPNIAISVRRLHDAGYSGAFYCLSFIPYLGSFIVLILCGQPTSPAAAQYGPPYPDMGYGSEPARGYPPAGGFEQAPYGGQPAYGPQGYDQPTYDQPAYDQPTYDQPTYGGPDSNRSGIDPETPPAGSGGDNQPPSWR